MTTGEEGVDVFWVGLPGWGRGEGVHDIFWERATEGAQAVDCPRDLSRVRCCMRWGGGRRTPLKPMHFRPTSLINSAVSILCCLSLESLVARLYSTVNDSGEFIVIVVAVCSHISLISCSFLDTFTHGQSKPCWHSNILSRSFISYALIYGSDLWCCRECIWSGVLRRNERFQGRGEFRHLSCFGGSSCWRAAGRHIDTIN